MNQRKIKILNTETKGLNKTLTVVIDLPQPGEVIRQVSMPLTLSMFQRDSGADAFAIHSAIDTAIGNYREKNPQDWKGFDTDFIIKSIDIPNRMIRFDVVRAMSSMAWADKIIEKISQIEV